MPHAWLTNHFFGFFFFCFTVRSFYTCVPRGFFCDFGGFAVHSLYSFGSGVLFLFMILPFAVYTYVGYEFFGL